MSGVERARAEVDAARLEQNEARECMTAARVDYDAATARLGEARLALSRAQMIAPPCPVCGAPPDYPCNGIAPQTHTKRAIRVPTEGAPHVR